MIDVSKIYKTNNCGDIVINKYVNAGEVHIQFVNTGNVMITKSCSIKTGAVKDKMCRSIHGVGFIGIGPHKACENRVATKPYRVWGDMIVRCYSEYYRANYPTYDNCTVCDEWYNYQNFATWFNGNYIDGHQLDKDIKISGNKIYSPETCIFVSQIDNVRKATSKNYKFISPKGEIVNICNLSEFCRKNNLPASGMNAVANGSDKSCRGWKAYA